MSRERPPSHPPTIIVRPVRAADGTASDLDALSPDERDHANRLHDDETRRIFVARRALLRRELGALSGQAPEKIVIAYAPCAQCGGAHGRPYPQDIDVHFSLTSVRGAPSVVGLALAERPVGFDLEQVATLDVVRDVAVQLHSRERAAITRALEESSDAACRVFTEIWTRKEALLKGTGEGITVALDRDDVSDASRRVTGWQISMWSTGRDDVVGAWALASPRG